MKTEVYSLYRNTFPYISRNQDTIKRIIDNENNVFFVRRNEEGQLIACAIVNRNTILLLVVDEKYRNHGIGTGLLNECENHIISNGYDKIVLGVGFDYLMPGVPTSKKYAPSIHESLVSSVNSVASDFFERHGYTHSWGDCNCFDMKMELSNISSHSFGCKVGDIINGVLYRWADDSDIESILKCADDACKYQDHSFSKHYNNPDLYSSNPNKRVLVAVRENSNEIIGCIMVSSEDEEKDTGNVGCTCVVSSEWHKGIGTNLVRAGTNHLCSLGLKYAGLSYTYSGLDKMYGDAGYEISCYYMMGEKIINDR